MNFFLNDKITNRFIDHNLSIFKKKKKSEDVFLLEFNGWQGVQIANSYLINSIPSINNCKIIAFESYRIFQRTKYFILQDIKWFFGSIFKIKNFGIYKSFGTDKFIFEKKNFKIQNQAKITTNNFFSKIIKKRNLENFCIKNIWIGDLIYDSYLKKYNEPTINFKDKKFKTFFALCIENFFFWYNYFRLNNVKGVATAHGVYMHAIPIRIAVKKNIPAYICNDSKIFRINKKMCSFKKKTPGMEMQNIYFRGLFNKFTINEKRIGHQKGKLFLENLINEKSQYFYSSKKKNKKIVNKLFFKKNNQPKIVIYAHSFFDSPHARGKNLFSDFYEWLNYLSLIAPETNYDWYIKPHPNYSHENLYINDFVKKNPFIKKIDSDASNLALVNEGLKYVLTMFGSCASELPYLGVKVVNACVNNPHIKYNFSITPKNINAYKNVILNLRNIKLDYSKNELYEYHYMNQYYFTNNYLFSNMGKYHTKTGGRAMMYTKKIFNEWIKNFSKEKHCSIIESINNFDINKEYAVSQKIIF